MWLSLIYSNTVQHNQKHSNPCGFYGSFGDKQKAVMTCFSPLHLMDSRIVFPQKKRKVPEALCQLLFLVKNENLLLWKVVVLWPMFFTSPAKYSSYFFCWKKTSHKKYKQLFPLTLSDNVICREQYCIDCWLINRPYYILLCPVVVVAKQKELSGAQLCLYVLVYVFNRLTLL